MAPGLVGPEKVAPTDTWWMTILPTNGSERTDYPTQEPSKLLERIVRASTNPGDLVADFFGGSGTTGVAAKRLGRRYLLVDDNPTRSGSPMSASRASRRASRGPVSMDLAGGRRAAQSREMKARWACMINSVSEHPRFKDVNDLAKTSDGTSRRRALPRRWPTTPRWWPTAPGRPALSDQRMPPGGCMSYS